MEVSKSGGMALLAVLCVGLWAAAAASAEVRPTAVITYYASDDGAPAPDHVEKTADVMFENGPPKFAFTVEQYFKTVTGGGVDFSGDEGDVFGPYQVATAKAGCPFSAWNNEARMLAEEKDGFSASDYAQVIYLYENEPFAASTCLSAGAGGGSFVWVDSLSGYTIVHELGHALGSPHAAAYRCVDGGGTPVAYSANCSEVWPETGEPSEYGDPFDPMGFGHLGGYPAEMSAWRKLGFGALAPGDAPTIAYSGTYALAPLEAAAGVRLLRIPNGAGEFFDLDFRQPIGPFDQAYGASSPAVQGVMIRVDEQAMSLAAHPSRLLDMSPQTPSFGDAPLAVGQQFHDFRTGVSVETLTVSAGGATVRISGLPDPPTAQSCKVPRLKGKTFRTGKGRKEMKLIFKKSRCKLGKVKHVRSTKVPKGGIVSQRPQPRRTVPAGTKVKVSVSSGPGPAPKGGAGALPGLHG